LQMVRSCRQNAAGHIQRRYDGELQTNVFIRGSRRAQRPRRERRFFPYCRRRAGAVQRR
jgi:hypothetical protein